MGRIPKISKKNVQSGISLPQTQSQYQRKFYKSIFPLKIFLEPFGFANDKILLRAVSIILDMTINLLIATKK